MNEHYELLISVYGENQVAYVATHGELLQRAMEGSSGTIDEGQMGAANVMVRKLKLKIEERLKDCATLRQFLIESLKYIREFVHYPQATANLGLELEITHRLLLQMYARSGLTQERRWSQKEIDHFEYVSKCLKSWDVCFLSYTNRGSLNQNNYWRQVINHHVEQEVQTRLNREKSNLMISAVINCLKRRYIRAYFYDRRNVAAGAPLASTLLQRASKTFSFVQLIQIETFDATATPNWCYDEYQAFEQHNLQERNTYSHYGDHFDRRYQFVLMVGDLAKQVADLAPPQIYQPWINRVFNTNRYLELTEDSNEFDMKMQELATSLINVQNQLIASI